MKKSIWYGLLLSVAFFSCGKNAPTDNQLKDLCRDAGFALSEENDSMRQSELFRNLAEESAKTYDLEKIAPEQVDLLFEAGGTLLNMPLRHWLSPVLKRKAEKGSTVFAYYYWKYFSADVFNPIRPDEEVAAYKALLSRNDLAAFIKEMPEAGADIVAGAAEIDAGQWARFELTPFIKTLLACPLSNQAIEQTVKVFNTMFGSGLPQNDKEAIRLQVLKLYQNLAEQTESPSQKKRAEAQIKYLQSAFATGTLVGNKAPAMHFRWISGGNEKTLDDFNGKVVMIDFWATQCAPCVKSFPQMAELQNHYRNRPVVLIGVTSIQGYFVDTPNGTTVNTADDPEKEISLVPAYMRSMGINWRIAFSEEDVMNVEYGVLAIPHITLIDKEGRVRYNGIDSTNEEKIKLIDSLLNE